MEKSKAILQSLLPVVMWLAVQSVVSLVFLFWRDYPPYFDGVLINFVTLVIGGIWYQSLKKRENTQEITVSPVGWIGLALLGGAIQFCTSFAVTGILGLFPQEMKNYANVMESLGMYSPTFFSVVYTMLLAPFLEELIFRGLTLKILEKSFPFWIANILQALYFGIIHGNIIQSTYAFLAGLLFGSVMYKYKSLKCVIWCHFFVNFLGMALGIFPIPLWTGVLLTVVPLGILWGMEKRKVDSNLGKSLSFEKKN